MAELPAPPAEKRQRLTTALTRIKGYALKIKGSVRTIMIVFLASGGWIWGVLYFPFTFSAGWQIALAIVLGLALLIPGAVVALFYLGLNALAEVPTKLKSSLDAGRTHTSSIGTAASLKSPEPGRVRITTMLSALWGLRTLVLDSKEMLIGYAAVARMVNPATLIGTGIALAAGVVLTIVAFISLVIVLL